MFKRDLIQRPSEKSKSLRDIKFSLPDISCYNSRNLPESDKISKMLHGGLYQDFIMFPKDVIIGTEI